jgi:hypothetical protein
MTQTNLYLGTQRGSDEKDSTITLGTSPAGTSVDVELNIQTVNGATPTGILKKDVVLLTEKLLRFIESGGLNHAGAGIPVL